MNHSSYYYRPQRRKNGSGNYILPFLILIAAGVILVLLVKLWTTIFKEESVQGAYIHIVEGGVQLKTWGTDDFFDLSTDALILHGDEIRTSADARLIVEFFDGTLMRLGGGTEVVFQEIDSESKVPRVELLFVDGQAWFNKVYKSTAGTEFLIKMNNVNVISDGGSIFAVDNDFDETVRVIHGDEVVVDVLSEEDDKIVEETAVGVGQEIVFTDEVLEKYWQFQSPSVLSAVSDEFKQSAWYGWNIDEDQDPTEFVKTTGGDSEFVKVAPEVIDGSLVEESDVEESDDVDEIEDEVEIEDEEEAVDAESENTASGSFAAPTITSVAGVTEKNANGFYVISSKVGTLTGSVSGAAKVVINDYILTQFKPGDTTWTYYANADYGLMKSGENIYQIYAIDDAGNKSATLTVKVLYNPSESTAPPATNTEDSEEEPVTEEESEDSESPPPPDWLTAS